MFDIAIYRGLPTDLNDFVVGSLEKLLLPPIANVRLLL